MTREDTLKMRELQARLDRATTETLRALFRLNLTIDIMVDTGKADLSDSALARTAGTE